MQYSLQMNNAWSELDGARTGVTDNRKIPYEGINVTSGIK